MRAYESKSNNRPKSDYTTAEGKTVINVYTAPPGYRIMRIEGERVSRHKYRDSNHSRDRFNLTGNGPVRRLVYVGDTKGKEAGTRTQVDITFNRLNIYLQQYLNCKPAEISTSWWGQGQIALIILAHELTVNVNLICMRLLHKHDNKFCR